MEISSELRYLFEIFLLVKRGTSPTYGDFELGKSSLHVFFANKPCLISGGYFLGDSADFCSNLVKSLV